MKKKVYIISHSHWDREWYLPYEQHHMLLVELMDDLFADTLWIHLFGVMLVSYYLLRVSTASSRAPF